MRGSDTSEPEAVIFEPRAELRRDLQIFLVRHCGLATLQRAEIGGYELAAGAPPKLIVTSGFQHDGSGLRFIRQVRERQLPSFVLYLDHQATVDEGSDAFAAGADDVIRLPFTMREFGLRLRARLGADFMRNGANGSGLVPQVMLDADNRLVAAGTPISVQLTPAEADVMAVLIRQGGEIVTRDELSRRIDQCEWVYGDRKFDVHVTKIRKKLAQAFGGRYLVRSIRNEGYAFCEAPAASEQTGWAGRARRA